MIFVINMTDQGNKEAQFKSGELPELPVAEPTSHFPRKSQTRFISQSHEIYHEGPECCFTASLLPQFMRILCPLVLEVLSLSAALWQNMGAILT